MKHPMKEFVDPNEQDMTLEPLEISLIPIYEGIPFYPLEDCESGDYTSPEDLLSDLKARIDALVAKLEAEEKAEGEAEKRRAEAKK